MYADASNKNANAFNCIQRGHQNSLEGFPLFVGFLLVAGVKVSRLILAAQQFLPPTSHTHSPESLRPAVPSGSLMLWPGLDSWEGSVLSGMNPNC